MFNNKSQGKNERVIVDGRIVDVATLRDEARKAGTRFWVLLVLVSLISSMVVPYLSMASIVASNSRIFDSEAVIPGYSMGGIEISSYGVDINSWGQSPTQSESNPHIVQSTYGYWTKERAENASKNLVASQKADEKEAGDLTGFAVDDSMMSSEEKAKGWIGITRDGGEGIGLSDFHTTKSGRESTNRDTYDETVAPYRTQEDWKYWDTRTVGGPNATMTATVYPDFVIFGWNDQTKTARVLSNPDSIENPATSKSSDSSASSAAIAGTMAIPRYVPISTLFKEFGLDKTVMGDNGMNDMDALLAAIKEDAAKHGGKSEKLNKIVENKENKPEYDLLVGTHYDNLNGSNKSKEPGSDAWNPYPYSLVFSMPTSAGLVTSSIYNNTEAYVYFSPSSVYSNYMTLRNEYDELVKAYATSVSDENPATAFQLGYYLAGMSILEAYLNEALPQDMTRGYVGPSEGKPIASENSILANDKKLDTRSGDSNTVSRLFKDSLGSVDGSGGDAVGFKSVAYSQLMYDFADAAIAKFGQSGESARLGMTSAIMNTLSTYGYGTKDKGSNVNADGKSAGQGPNRGMTRRQAMAKVTAFGPYGNGAKSLDVSGVSDKEDPLYHPDVANVANTGFYVPGYYPVQQHEMALSEATYRFQVVSDLPYQTAVYELALHGFNSSVSLSYQNNAIENLSQTKQYYNKAASLSKQLNDIDEQVAGMDLGSYDAGESILLNPDATTTMVGEKMTKAFSDEKDLTTRVDNAFLAFKQGRMNADNVHDLIDIARAIPGVKYETFMRYYNPLKSSGGADDLFLTRVTPAQTAYMPKMLTNGYESAGGTTNNAGIVLTSNASYDYFSIPSFGPCFAAKTAEGTYYGTLNYELRPFYTEGFLSNLPANANVPALEKYEAAKSDDDEDEDDEEDDEDQTSIDGIKDKVVTIYILAKRLSFATAYGKMMDAHDGGETSVSLGALDAAGLQGNIVASKNLAAIKAALDPKDKGKYVGTINDNGSEGLVSHKTNHKVKQKSSKNSSSSSSSGSVGKGAQAITNAAEKALASNSCYSFGGNPFANGVTVAEVGETNGVLNLPNTDCSGLVSFCLAQTGLTSTRYCSSDFPNDSNFVEVSYENAQPGDVAWWSSHVAVYMGNDVTIEHVSPPGAPIAQRTGHRAERYYHFKLLDSGSSGVATVIASLVTSVAGRLVSMAVQVDSGDFVSMTGTEGTSQTTVWYDDGNGTATAVAYVNTESGWMAQAESTSTAMPTVDTTNGIQQDAAANGIPVSLTLTQDVPSVPPASLANGYNTNQTPADASKDEEAAANKGNGSNASSSGNASGTGASGANPTASGTGSQAVAEDDSPYADNGGEADQIYIRDHLAAKGFIKASATQWDAIKGQHSVSDTISMHIPSGMRFESNGSFDYVMQKFGQKHIIPDETLNKKVIWCKDSNGYAFVTDVKTAFTGLYNDAFNGLLVPSGTYYWDTPGNIAGYGGKFDNGDSKDDEMVEYNTVALDYAKAGNTGDARDVIDEYCREAFGDAAQVWKNMAALNDELPQQMQNVLAWADCQTAAESESYYMGDDSQPNLIITIGSKKVQTPSIGIIRSLADLESAQFEIADNDGDWAAIPIVDNGQEDDDLQSRMTRGVAGTTSTASRSLAGYTITATVGRIDRLVSSNASQASIPYSGICSGNLMAGTDRYAQLQGHSVDHEGISSGLKGDLKSTASSTTKVKTASSTTDAGTQKAIGKAANLVSEYASASIPAAIDGVTAAFSSALPDVGTDKTLESDMSIAGAVASTFSSPSSQTMAMTSTFDSTTMNRKSASAQKASTGTGTLVANGGTSTYASAAGGGLTQNRQLATSLVNGKFSDAYAVIQSISLLMVLAFLMIIAFQNFVGYTSGKEDQYIEAQTKLKTVLPRTLIAVAMIGLPPMGGQQGFPGGCYLLLQIVNAIMDATIGVFTQGSSTMQLLEQIRACLTETSIVVWPWNIDLSGIILNLLACGLFSIAAAIVMVLIMVTDLLLLAFWAFGPVMWAFYTWPYNGSQKPKGNGALAKFLTTMTGKMGVKTISGKSIGNDAPSGWLLGYITTLGTIACWNIMFWIAGNVFAKLRGNGNGALSTSGTQGGKLAPVKIISGTDVLTGQTGFLETPAGGLILVILFCLLVTLMYLLLKHTAGGIAGIVYKGVGGTIETVRSHIHHEVGDMAFVSEAERKRRLDKGIVTRHLSEEQRQRIAKATSNVSDTAVKLSTVARVADNASRDVGNRMNKLVSHYSKPVQQRKDTSGAFDGLLTIEDEMAYETDASGRQVAIPTGRKKLHASPALYAVKEAVTDTLSGFGGSAGETLLQNKIDRIDARLESIDEKDPMHKDLRQLKALRNNLSPDCVRDQKLDVKAVRQSISSAYSALEAAEQSGDHQQIDRCTNKLKKQLATLEAQPGEDKLNIDRLKGMSSKERKQAITEAAEATDKKFFQKRSAEKKSYSERLLDNEQAIKENHKKYAEEEEVLKAIRDKTVAQMYLLRKGEAKRHNTEAPTLTVESTPYRRLALEGTDDADGSQSNGSTSSPTVAGGPNGTPTTMNGNGLQPPSTQGSDSDTQSPHSLTGHASQDSGSGSDSDDGSQGNA